jgi:mono/diheme cytochrome c family protein
MNIKNAFPLIIAVIAFSACSNDSSSSDKAGSQVKTIRPAAEEKVSAIFQAKCAACHGVDGTAGIANAANLQQSKITGNSIIKMIADGKGAMPSFKGEFNDSEINKIANYVRSLRK